MKSKILFIVCYSLIAIYCIQSQPVQQEWVARYNGPANNDDEASSIAVDTSGNVYVTGTSFGNGTDYDYATVKYNSVGVQQWVAIFNGTGNGLDQSHALALDRSGNVYVTGRSYGTGHWDYATVKYNSSGVQQWVQRYHGSGVNYDDEAYAIIADLSGNVYITGSSNDMMSSNCVTIKYNTLGIQQWLQSFDDISNGQDEGHAITVDASGNVYVAGFCSVWTPLNTRRYLTIKYNSAGVQQWVQTYYCIANSQDEAHAIVVDASGNVYVTGYSLGNGTWYDYATIKYNPAGVQQWVQRYNGLGNYYDNATSIALDGTGNIYVTGYSQGVSSGYDYATIKYNSSGVQQWVQRYDGPADTTDVAYSILTDLPGNVYVTGYSRASANSGWGDYATVKYNSSGVQQWVERYNGPGNNLDRAQSMALDNAENVYVTGYSMGNGSNYDYATIKYSQPNNVKHLNNEIPVNYQLFQNYPNPFNPRTIINFQLPMSGNVKLMIYDILGREVTTLVNQQLKPGTYKVEWDGSDYPSGVYFYKLITDNYNEARKMVLVK